MKNMIEGPVGSDRTSTREELYQVIELLGGRGSSRLEYSLEAPETALHESEEQGDLWAQVTRDEELALAAEIEPLADLFLGTRELIN